MTIDDVAKGVRQAWDFTIPPIARLILVLGATYYVSPTLSVWAARAMGGYLSMGPAAEPAVRSMLEFYGIAKILPIVLLLAMAALLELFERMVSSMGRYVPPDIHITQPNLFAAAVPDPHIARLWRCHRSATTLEELRLSIEATFTGLSKVDRSHWQHWDRIARRAVSLFALVKCGVVWVIGVAVLALYTGLSDGEELKRVAAYLVLSLVLGGYALVKYLYATMQQEVALVRVVTARASHQAGDSSVTPDRLSDKYVAGEIKKIKNRWWRLSLTNNDLGRWAWKYLVLRRSR